MSDAANPMQTVTHGAMDFLSNILGAPFRFIGGAISGFFGGMFKWGIAFFLLQITGLARPIEQALGGQPLLDKMDRLEGNGANSLLGRIVSSALLGGAFGAVTNGTKKVIGVEDKGGGGLMVDLGVVAAVTVAAVMLNKHDVHLTGEHAPLGGAATLPGNIAKTAPLQF